MNMNIDIITEINTEFKKEIAEFIKLEKNRKPVHKSTPSFNLIEKLYPDNTKMYENAHTRVLRAILDVNWEFQRSFLERCCEIKIKSKTKLKVEEERQYKKINSKWKLCKGKTREKKEDEGVNLCRPDCLLWSPNKFAVIIENKLNGAPETKNQLDNYLEAIPSDKEIFKQKKNEQKDVHVVYLCGDATEMPSEHSLKKAGKGFLAQKDYLDKDAVKRNPGKKLHLVAYTDTIIPWLEEDVLPKCLYGMTGLIGGLMAYIDYLKMLFSNNATEEERFNDSPEVLDFFREKIEFRLGKFFHERYTAVSEHVRYIESEQITGKQDKEKNSGFFKALRSYYLKHHFRFSDSQWNNQWAIRTTGSLIHLWKRNWERIQDRSRLTCDLYFEFYPYQVDEFYYDYDKFVKQAVTCCLRYKGRNVQFRKKLMQSLENKRFIQDGGYVFNKALQMQRKTFVVKKGDPFFDTFVKDGYIVQMCATIEGVLNEFCEN